MKTTIQLDKTTMLRLQGYKYHPRESYDAVLNRLINWADEDAEELTPEELKEIEEGLEDIKHGRTISHEDLAKELGVDLNVQR